MNGDRRWIQQALPAGRRSNGRALSRSREAFGRADLRRSSSRRSSVSLNSHPRNNGIGNGSRHYSSSLAENNADLRRLDENNDRFLSEARRNAQNSPRASGRHTPPALDSDNETLSDASSLVTDEEMLSNSAPASEDAFGPHNPAFPSNLNDDYSRRRLTTTLLAFDNFAASSVHSGASPNSHRSLKSSRASRSTGRTQSAYTSHNLFALDESSSSFEADKTAFLKRAKHNSFALETWLGRNDDPWSSLSMRRRR